MAPLTKNRSYDDIYQITLLKISNIFIRVAVWSTATFLYICFGWRARILKQIVAIEGEQSLYIAFNHWQLLFFHFLKTRICPVQILLDKSVGYFYRYGLKDGVIPICWLCHFSGVIFVDFSGVDLSLNTDIYHTDYVQQNKIQKNYYILQFHCFLTFFPVFKFNTFC